MLPDAALFNKRESPEMLSLSPMSSARKAAYALFGLLVLAVFWLRLGPVALAGLFSYLVLDAAHRRLAARLPPRWARAAALAVFFVIAVGVAVLFARFVTLGQI